MNYWDECISEAFEDAGIAATEEQMAVVSGWVEGAHENYGMAHGYDAIPNPAQLENDKLRMELKKEQDKVICRECRGRGRITINGPIHSGTSECHVCRGEGRTLP